MCHTSFALFLYFAIIHVFTCLFFAKSQDGADKGETIFNKFNSAIFFRKMAAGFETVQKEKLYLEGFLLFSFEKKRKQRNALGFTFH